MLEPLGETFGNVVLPIGGKHGYVRVRGSQGPKKDKFQGYTPKKRHFTKNYNTAHEAAINLALLERELGSDIQDDEEKKPRKKRCDTVAARRAHATCTAAHPLLTL